MKAKVYQNKAPKRPQKVGTIPKTPGAYKFIDAAPELVAAAADPEVEDPEVDDEVGEVDWTFAGAVYSKVSSMQPSSLIGKIRDDVFLKSEGM